MGEREEVDIIILSGLGFLVQSGAAPGGSQRDGVTDLVVKSRAGEMCVTAANQRPARTRRGCV